MPMINIGESEFMVLANAANLAEQHGNHEDALALDKLARKANAALSGSAINKVVDMRMTKNPKWQDMPSTLRNG